MRPAARAALPALLALLAFVIPSVGSAVATVGTSSETTTAPARLPTGSALGRHHPIPAIVAPRASLPARPPIRNWPIPFGAKRKHEMAAYSERHYGERTWRLTRPRVIVEHMAETGSAAAVHNTFAADVPDVELHELPQVCSHFVISSAGRIYRMVNLRTRCRHTVGLNWTSIGIEHTGYADSDALDDPAQMRASLRLTQWLRCSFHIRVKNVIGHAESLSSPYHRELVPSLQTQTHGDWRHSSMQVYRRRLRALGPC